MTIAAPLPTVSHDPVWDEGALKFLLCQASWTAWLQLSVGMPQCCQDNTFELLSWESDHLSTNKTTFQEE